MVRPKPHRGLMHLEIVVAAFLLGALVTSIASLNYRLLGVAKDTKHYQLALHEAANQVDMLTAGGFEGLDDRIAKTKLPEDILQVLPGGKLDVQKKQDASGTQVVVRIGWDRPGTPTQVELVGWVSTTEVSK
ncbi:MAG: hypothetical protein ACKN9S_08305 [Pirellula sp.]